MFREKKVLLFHQGCQIYHGPNIPNWEIYNKRPQTIPKGHELYYINGHTIFQMVIKYTNIYHSKALQNLHKLGFLV
jgi:hypothetical protein